jgi:PKD domain
MRFLGRGGVALAAALVFCAAAQARPPRQPIRAHRAHVARAGHEPEAHAANLPYGGGPVLHWNRTHVIFWQPAGSGLTFDPGYQSLIVTFLRNVAAASHSQSSVYGLTGQYQDGSGRATYASVFGGSVLDSDPLPPNGCQEPSATGPGWTVCLTDAQLQREIEHVIRANRMATGGNDIYFLVTPNGFGDCSDSSSTSCALGGDANGYCGYHSQTSDGLVLYAVIPYNAVPGHCQSDNPRPNNSSADPALSTISHEQDETITDPAGNAWIDPDTGEEMADLCLSTFGPAIGGTGAAAWNEDINGGHYYLQEQWSNADGACEPRAKPDSLAFSTAPVAGPRGGLAFTARAHAGHGSIVSYQWFFGDRGSGHGRRATHRFGRPGSYRVVLRTTDSWGNWTFYARTVVVSGGREARTASATKRG